MLDQQRVTASPTDFFGESSGPTMAVPNIPALLKRRWRAIAIGGAIGIVLALTYVALATPLYKATATVVIDPRMNQTLKKQDIIDDTQVDTNLVDSQVEIISSETIALQVIKKFHLDHDPEFIGPPSHLGALIVYDLRKLSQKIKQSIGADTAVSMGEDQLNQRLALDTFADRLKAARRGLSYVIDIDFASEDPKRGPQIANAVAMAYISGEQEARFQATQKTSKWLDDRLAQIRSEATAADRAVQTYKSANNIVDASKGLLNEQEISDLSSQLVSAQSETAQAKARLDRIKQAEDSEVANITVADALNNQVITRLRSQYLDLANRRADLVTRLGVKHAVIQKMDGDMQSLKSSIRNELDRISQAYASDFQIALAREQSLTKSMAGMISNAGVNSQAQVKMRDLQSASDAYRSLYDSFLQKFQEMVQQQSIPLVDARVITVATVPIDKWKPKTVLALLAGLILGMGCGGGVGVASDLMSGVLRTARQVETAIGFPCLGILPAIPQAKVRKRRRGVPRLQGRSLAVYEHVLDAPLSRFAETIRSVKVAISSERLARDCSVVAVVSSVAGEGKSTLAANLGASFAITGSRTLVIDGDIRHGSLSKAFAADAREGLVQAVIKPERLAQLAIHLPRQKFDFLPFVASEGVDSQSELLGSEQMGQLLEGARRHYETVIIDLAPVVPVVDAKAISHLVDGFVFVIEWGRSAKDLVVEAVGESSAIRDRLLGAVLNNADPVSLKRDEAYKGKKFASYYTE